MKFNSQIATTIEQSKRLLMLGLKPETADLVYSNASLPYDKDVFQLICRDYPALNESVNFEISPFTFIPAWSLHRLIELYKDVEDTSMWSLENVNYNRLIQCIGLAIKHNDFNKEYLK